MAVFKSGFRVAVATVLALGGFVACSTSAPEPSEVADGQVAKTQQALAPGWTPNSLSPAAWYVASSSDYVPTHDANNNVNGYKWTDRSTNHRDATTVANASWVWPTLVGNGWFGLPTLHFDGGDMLSVPAWSGAPSGATRDFGVLAVVRSTSAAQNAAVVGWWDPNGNGFAWAQLKGYNGLTFPDLTRTYGLGSSQAYTGPHDLGTGPHVVVWRYASSTQKIQITVDGKTMPSSALPPINDLPTMPFLIGAKSTLPTGLFTGDISELAVVGREVLDADVQNFTDYARLNWTNNLPAQGSADPCTKADGTAIAAGPPYTHCDDGIATTFGDHCSAGSCVGTAPLTGSPAELAPLAWYHAGSQELSFTDGAVSTWFDRTSNHFDLAQGFYNARPAHDDTYWDGSTKPALKFLGYNVLKRLSWSGAPAGTGTPFTAYAVLRSNVAQSVGLASWANNNGYGLASCQLKNGATGTALDLVRTDDSGANQQFLDSVNPDLGTAKHVVIWQYSPNVAKLTVDGRTATVTSQSTLGSVSPSELLVGGVNDFSSTYFNGYLAELAVLPGSISDAQLTRLSQYASSEWGITLACQADCTGKTCGADNGCGRACDCGACTTNVQCSSGFSCVSGQCTSGSGLNALALSVQPSTVLGDGSLGTPLDNPVITGQVPLDTSEKGVRTSSDTWAFTRFELHLQTLCNGDSLCRQTGPTDDGVLNAWPAQVGTVTAGQQLPVEVHGVSLGTTTAATALQEYTRDGTRKSQGSVNVHLLPGTILVPVNIVVVEPTASVDANERSYMQRNWENVQYYQALFDDLWIPSLQRFSDPGALLNEIDGSWTRRSHASTDGATFTAIQPDPGEGYTRPDDIFAQCGIQFRLASVVTIDESNRGHVIFTTDGTVGGPVLCSDGANNTLTGIYDGWKNTAMTAPTKRLFGNFVSSSVTVEFSPLIVNSDCLHGDKGLTDRSAHISAIGVEEPLINNNRFVLAHEMGHALGMAGDIVDTNTGSCPNLMCASSWSTHIPGCQTRDGAPLSAPPYNCTPRLDETITVGNVGASCDLARAAAKQIAMGAMYPLP